MNPIKSSAAYYYRVIPEFDRALFHYINVQHKPLLPKLIELLRDIALGRLAREIKNHWKVEMEKCGKALVAL